jgi:uncharacterized membrane protein
MQRRTRRATPGRQKRQNLAPAIHVHSRIPLARVAVLVFHADGAESRRVALHTHDPQRPVRGPADPADGLPAGAPAAGDYSCAVGEDAGGGFGFGVGFRGAGGPGSLEGEDPVYLVLLLELALSVRVVFR